MLRHHGLVVALSLSICCAGAASQSRVPYEFNGIVLDAPEAELPKEYKAAFATSDCLPDRQGSTPVKHCTKVFTPQSLPGLEPDVEGSIHFGVHYFGGRLRQIAFIFPRNDYAAFVAMLRRRHGAPSFTQSEVELPDFVKATTYTWTTCIRGRGRFSIATYPFTENNTSRVYYTVVTQDPMCPYRAP